LEVRVEGNLFSLFSRYASSLKEILNVSKVTVIEDLSNKGNRTTATGTKCARCWNFMPEVSNYGIMAKRLHPLPGRAGGNEDCSAQGGRQ
jgi:hypothetical protein